MASEKTPNYTPEQTEKLVKSYRDAGTEQTEAGQAARKAVVSLFAKEFDKNEKSIVAKLTREGCYVKAERLTKAGEAVTKKDTTASAIGSILALDEASIDSLCKANKKALSAIFSALANSVPVEVESEAERGQKAAYAATVAGAAGVEAGDLMRVNSGVLARLAAVFTQ